MAKRIALSFTDDEYNELSEALRIAQQSLIEESDRLAELSPGVFAVERFRQWAERFADLREKVEGR